MSTFKVPLTTIKEVLSHPNADRLSIAKIYDWHVVIQKDKYKVGDAVIYVPVDSILSQELEAKIFPPDSKIKLNKRRIRSIKIRGYVSQGMIINPNEVAGLFEVDWRKLLTYEDDVSQELGITKYEPEVKDIPKQMQAKAKKKGNSFFKKYSDIENFKYYDRIFQDDEQVYISEKLHGTSFRAGWFPMEVNTLWKKFLKLINKLPAWEFCYGSRNAQIQDQLLGHPGFKSEAQGVNFGDVYTKMVNQYNLKDIIPEGYAVYGEIVGEGIQKNYTYGCKNGEHKLYIYDIMFEGKWLDYPAFKRNLDRIGLTPVPKLYLGPYKRETLDKLRDGDSTIADQKIREGVVVKPVVETVAGCGRKILKYISEAYYMKQAETDGSEFH